MSITSDQIPGILAAHAKWLRNESGSRANLSGANLSGVNLSGANLSWAKIDGEEITSTASVAFSGHGQFGRQLLAIAYGKNITLWCGCFTGTPKELGAYIKNGEPRYAKTRTLALKTVLVLLKAKNQ